MTALITGASSGIGLELARILAADHHDVVLVARNLDKLNELKQELESKHGIKAIVIPADLSIPRISDEIYYDLANKGVQVDILINNAGFGDYGAFANAEWKKQANMLQVNIVALTHLTKLFLRGMVDRGNGRIMNVASTAAFQPGPLMAVYYATKAYVLHFSEAIANELQGTGVTVTTLCPGPTRTEFQSTATMGNTRLLRIFNIPSAESVARFGYRAMMKGKTVAIYGLFNYLLSINVRFLPRSLTTWFSRQFLER